MLQIQGERDQKKKNNYDHHQCGHCDKIYANSVQGDGEIGLLLALLHIWAKHECSLSLNAHPLSKCEFQLDDWIQVLVIMGEDWLDVHIGQS